VQKPKIPNLDLEKSIWNLEKISPPIWNLEKRLEKFKKNFHFQKNLCSRRKHMNFICIVLEVGAETKSTCTLTLHWLQDER
jgi:hypothetical protein